jgi:glucans biosynthesis protein C
LPTSDASVPVGRHYGMDWLRIGAFALLILYHIGMFFVPWEWHVKTAEPLEWARIPMLATNSWRIPLLFVVSGYASAALLAKSRGTGPFLADRSARLLIPLAASMVLFVPPQPWVELVHKHGYDSSFAGFWLGDYFRFSELHGIMLPTWNHMWFVAYLWVYSVALGVLVLAPARVREWVRRAAELAFGGWRVLAVPLALIIARLWHGWPVPEPTHDLVGDAFAHTLWFALFAFGFALRGSAEIWRGIRRWWGLAAIVALAAYGYVAWVALMWGDSENAPAIVQLLREVARQVQMWTAIVALLGVADRYWNRDHRWRATLTEAVFPFYIIHQTIIVVLGWYLLRFGLPPSAEFAVLLTATVAGCRMFYLGGRRVRLLRPLIGLRTEHRSAPRPGSTAVASGS